MARTERDHGIDLVKSISILGVIVIHTCTYGAPILSSGWLSNLFWGSLTRASVPLFLMCSGALFLAPEKPLSVRKLYAKTIPRILAAMFFWAMCYKLFHLLPHGLSPAALLQAVKEVLVFRQEFHLYYLQMILLVYAFLPVTALVTRHASRRQLEYALLLWFIFAILYPTVAPFWPFRLLGMMVPQYQINMTYASIGYGVLGFYLRQYPPRRAAAAVAALAGFAVTFGGTALLSARAGELRENFLQGMSVGVALMAAGIFLLCSGVTLKGRGADAAVYLSKASFCVYLCHMFARHLLGGFAAGILPPLAAVPLEALVILCISLGVYAVLSRIPVVRDWLI